MFAHVDSGNVLGAYAHLTDDLVTVVGPVPGSARSDTEAFLSGAFGDEDVDDGEDSSLVGGTNAMELAERTVPDEANRVGPSDP